MKNKPSLSKPFFQKISIYQCFLPIAYIREIYFEVLLPTDDELANWEYCFCYYNFLFPMKKSKTVINTMQWAKMQ